MVNYRKPQINIWSSLCTHIRTPLNRNRITYIPTATISNPEPNYKWVSPIKNVHTEHKGVILLDSPH